ncbi:cytochrome P450 [Streptomyces sp. NPDC093595]|uniref:cytochrome P450 n=1 Tax=Streptomyces sp. NPDC093595 TaxID=3366045 RepID=UPI00381D52F4
MSQSSSSSAPQCPRFPFPDQPGVELTGAGLRTFRDQSYQQVELGSGQQALLVTQYEDVKIVLTDPRFSREAWRSGSMFARKSEALALTASDAPTHTRRRRAVQARFTHRRAEQDRPRIVEIADSLLDRIEDKGPPADLVADFTAPFSYRVICEILGVPLTDLEQLSGWATTMASAGRFSAADIADAQQAMTGYFTQQLADRRRNATELRRSTDLLTDLLASQHENQLSDEEIIVLSSGLFMSAGETTASHLAMGVLQVLKTPGLAKHLRKNPADIPETIEELLRWTWFAGTGGQPHVAMEQVKLSGILIQPGQIVIPLRDAANRDAETFPQPDTFQPNRSPNPHLGFGHGRHYCLGAPHARVELEVGLSSILHRLEDLEVSLAEHQIDWRDQMFIRGPWKLPVQWRSPGSAV